MKTLTLLATVAGLLLSLPATFAGGTGCEAASWNPEIYTFYGAKPTIIENIETINAKLSERRVFIQITQGDAGSTITLYEKQGENDYTVTKWELKDSADLIAQIDKAILKNKGVNCAGEQVKSILTEKLKHGTTQKAVPAPASPKAAFAHPVKETEGSFVKTTIIILC